MASVNRRLQALENELLEAVGGQDGQDLVKEMFRRAHRRLSVVEMHVLSELREAYAVHSDLSPAK